MCLNKLKGVVRLDCWLSSRVGFGFIWSSGFRLARTSFFQEGLALYAITVGDGKF